MKDFNHYSFQKIDKMLKFLSRKELILLERKIKEQLSLKIMLEFKLTERVSFEYRGEEIKGTIIRLNQKTVTIIDDNGRHWNVAPSFLKKIS